ncbi:MAG: hypothetical protein WCK78_04265 [Paludibacter sp.]
MLANQTGLSTKVVSERHHYASQSKMTAGDVAKMLRKKGFTISAKEVKEAYILLNGREPEWHHAGFYKGAKGSTMGRTLFFTETEAEHIAENFDKISVLKAEQEANIQVKKETIVKGVFYSWDFDYNGKYGKKRNYKVLGTFEGSELGKPNNFITLTDEQFAKAETMVGKKYFGWDEPSRSEF